ncbi:hypothetical protein V9T40_011840 [Parthenolecanium corni]|uniref:Peroxin-19 n=1 Tax=Parthenolecanium corni TaxID=536013 RepID=A0AAN9XYY0_9HEMI
MTDTPAKKNESTISASSKSDDLNKLLKSALDDFDEPLPSSSEAPSKPAIEETAVTSENPQADFEEKFKHLLLADEDDASFSNKMTDLLMEVNKEIQQTVSESPSEGNDAVSQAINSLVENIEEIKDSITNDQFQGNFNMNDLKNDAMFPMMEQMFQMLMSKEVLYPSLLSVRDQYPSWLKDNSSKISAQEADRYTKQYNVIKKICVIFESESAADAEDVKQKKFIELLGLLEEMTALGQPPSDFAESLPSMAGANDVPDTCNTM